MGMRKELEVARCLTLGADLWKGVLSITGKRQPIGRGKYHRNPRGVLKYIVSTALVKLNRCPLYLTQRGCHNLRYLDMFAKKLHF